MPNYCFLGNERYINAVEGRLKEAGYKRIKDAAKAEWVVTFFTSMTMLEEAYFGDDGLVGTMRAGSIAIDLSACTPNLATEICSVATISNIVMVSAPLCVKNKLAEDVFARVNTYCYAGSEDDGVERALPMLDLLFGDVRPVADAGAAQLARTARTIQNTSEMVSAIEALSLFQACSKSVSSNVDVMALVPNATSPEAFFVLEAVREKRFYGDYTVEMLLSEISAAMMTADDFEMILPQTEAAFHLYELLAIIGGADMSPAALALVYEGDTSNSADGEDGKSEKKDDYGLDWSRVEQLYGSEHEHDHDHEHLDPLGFADGEDYLGDDLSEEYGFSVN